MGYIKTRDKVHIFYRIIGNGPKTILFIHPPGMGHITFKQQLPLAKDYRLLFIDLRGNGKSERNNTLITFPLLARDIFDVCHSLKIEKVILCGYSNGGSISLETALTYPNLVEGLVLSGAFPRVSTGLLGMEFILGIFASRLNGINIIAKVIGQAHTYSNGFAKELERYILLTSPRTLFQMYTEGLTYDCTSRLAKIKVPIQLVYGSQDYYVHHYQKEFLAFLPDTKISFIAKAKHQLPTKHPNEFNAIIKNYINFIQSNNT
ncbi:alpha/beta fold hydrolase [Sutcliffiella rhizosphaerae]|uniref:AB hydrolase superfamily protein YvaM n=1 Tax=Sutcliffiella rhizosphaerae TaxID=2880967 RepID=A0ABM8YKW3_9BACI|nr:alpha/beta hydrolase [Sutcliffiella rhizosphaerae]CAG9620606.1 AB hydrolase superfamily protein YvaM [Sutcliffiella rhizosphaerae]